MLGYSVPPKELLRELSIVSEPATSGKRQRHLHIVCAR
jgi:hypothetical protein